MWLWLCLVAVCVCLSLWLLLSVGSQGRNPNPAGTLIPCLTLGPVWVTGWIYGDAVGHVRATAVMTLRGGYHPEQLASATWFWNESRLGAT